MRSSLYIFLFFLRPLFIFGKTPSQLVCAVGNATCLVAEARDMFATIVEGSSSLHTEPLDPMFLDYLHIDQDLKIDLRNMKINGLKHAMITETSVDMSAKTSHMQYVSDLVLKSQYVTSGSLLSMPIEGKGNFVLKFYNMSVDMIVSFDIIKDAVGDNVMILKSHSYTYDIRDDAEYFFDNLYFGNETASEALHKSMHENWKLLSIEYGRYLLNLVNEKIFNSILIYTRARPLKELLEY